MVCLLLSAPTPHLLPGLSTPAPPPLPQVCLLLRAPSHCLLSPCPHPAARRTCSTSGARPSPSTRTLWCRRCYRCCTTSLPPTRPPPTTTTKAMHDIASLTGACTPAHAASKEAGAWEIYWLMLSTAHPSACDRSRYSSGQLQASLARKLR